MGTNPTLSDSVLMASIAQHHFLRGESKIEIAERLGISRFKVARLLDAAVQTGVVRIEIAPAFGVDLDTSARLRDQLGLTQCTVLAVDGVSAEGTRDALGKVAAQVLNETLGAGDVLGLPWSRSAYAMTRWLRSLPPVKVVQLSGSMESDDVDASAVDLVRVASRVSGGTSVIFHAPFILDSAEAADAVRRQPPVAAGLAAASDVTHAVLGVGAWAPGESTIYDFSNEQTRREISEAGAVGESAGVFFDDQGCPVDVAASRRLVTVQGEQLRAIPEVLGIAYGASKAEAVRAAVRGRLVTGLVTDSTIATALLQG